MNPFAGKTRDEVSEMWQVRALREAKGKVARILLVAFYQEYAAAFPILLRAVGIVDVVLPMYSGYATIMQSGRLVCDQMIDRAKTTEKTTVYRNEGEFIKDMRDFADRLKLIDKDREEMFAVLRKWVVADLRIDHMGRRLAS
jgi:hypothetical protein